ncbi:ankyrin repeat domain-containing protein 18A isoform X1 [Bactrocera tryoni]|uniref:ankyrin repeat domain-containing protein 18A isoform X1 n=1 Tax=Bactrocera tryoni TaxID=59916 RepID=UPI001A986E2C|nr:ankyrin repeat domain-containing protein 18A isoform X1 [Bactrocera tryoni]XP_039965707.1 ankyrin repeat domain-containing protein 18A isoform X1 [Bactrocera tryoni]
MVGGGGGGDNKVVATLRADGSVYPASGTSIGQLVNLMNYKIRTEVDVSNKALNTFNVPTTVVDLGKQLLQYARDGDLKGVKNMLSRGAPFTSDWLGMSALHFAAMNNQYEVCDALLKGGINKDSKTKVDRTPLHMACFYGNERIVELLLAKKCIVNPRDMLRMTPLHWAVEKGHKSIARLLLKHNADVTVTSKFGKTPIALAVLTEQADLLEELESARQSQINRKYNEEHEVRAKRFKKETSDAVNSIMGLTNFSAEEAASSTKITLEVDDELTNNSDFAESKISDLANIKETGVLDKTTINMLKDHGISMMPEDEDTSKELLATALQNGRQLVLSEGGKLLLNETKKIHNNNNGKSASSSSGNANSNTSNVRNYTVLPVRGTLASRTQNYKARASIISKAKDNLNMYKNVRIISLNDFKKFYGNTNIKGVQKIPASMASERLARIRQISEEQRILNPGNRQVYTNTRTLAQRQLKAGQTVVKTEQPSTIIAEDDDIDSIIQLAPTDSDTELSDSEHTQQQQQQTQQAQKQNQPQQKLSNVSIQGTKQLLNIAAPQVIRQLTTKQGTLVGTKLNMSGGEAAKPQAGSTVISLLSVPEICRQLYELRRQNDDLKRKFDVAQKEKEEMRQRLDRLEELLLVEKTDDGYVDT